MTEQKKVLGWRDWFKDHGRVSVEAYWGTDDRFFTVDDLYQAFKARLVEELELKEVNNASNCDKL